MGEYIRRVAGDDGASGGRAPNTDDQAGRRGEALAAHYLEEAGLCILERNWRSGRYEIDLVVRDGDTVAFVEVKTRRPGPQHPLESVSPLQMHRIRCAATAWIHAHPGVGREFRFDVVGVALRQGASPKVDHVPGAFTGDDS